MNKILFYVLYLLAALAVFIGLVGCSKTGGSAVSSSDVSKIESATGKTYIVRFDSNGGSAVPPENVTAGHTANKPDDPQREGYNFIGWMLNDVAFDFDTPISSDVILTAKWDKVQSFGAVSASSQFSGTVSASKNPGPATSSQNTTAQSSSHSGKVNLDDNISVRLYFYPNKLVYDVRFPTNFNEVFPYINGNVCTIDDPDGTSKNIITYAEWEAKESQLKYDESKEKAALKKLAAIASENYIGVANYTYNLSNHSIVIKYDYLAVSDKKHFPDLGNKLEQSVNKFQSKIDEAVSGAHFIGMGYAEPGENATLLTEDLCESFHIPYARW